MDTKSCEVIQLELKYCERCGGLWIRRLGAPEVYCSACAGAAMQFPHMRKVRSKPRLPASGPADFHGQLLALISQEGGRA